MESNPELIEKLKNRYLKQLEYSKNYSKKCMQDEEKKKIKYEKMKIYLNDRYKNDPEFKMKSLERSRNYRLKKKMESEK